MTIIEGFISVDGKRSIDKRLENTLDVQIKLYRSEWYSFYCDVSIVVDFDVSRKFSIQNATYGFR